MKMLNIFIADNDLLQLRLIRLCNPNGLFSLAKKLIDYLVICIAYFLSILLIFYCSNLSRHTAVAVPLTAICARFAPRATSSVVYISVICAPLNRPYRNILGSDKTHQRNVLQPKSIG